MPSTAYHFPRRISTAGGLASMEAASSSREDQDRQPPTISLVESIDFLMSDLNELGIRPWTEDGGEIDDCKL
ncbi:unnamed protein product [Victoria cruziana]